MLKRILLVALALPLPACGDRACTEIGCSDGITLSIVRPDSAWAAGVYALELAFDGHSVTCGFALPADFPATGSLREIPCETSAGAPVARVIFDQDTTCTTSAVEGGGVSESCQPIPDRYSLRVGLYGTPASATLGLTVDGAALVETTLMPSYMQAHPNGPDCEPVCRQASVDVMVR